VPQTANVARRPALLPPAESGSGEGVVLFPAVESGTRRNRNPSYSSPTCWRSARPRLRPSTRSAGKWNCSSITRHGALLWMSFNFKGHCASRPLVGVLGGSAGPHLARRLLCTESRARLVHACVAGNCFIRISRKTVVVNAQDGSDFTTNISPRACRSPSR